MKEFANEKSLEVWLFSLYWFYRKWKFELFLYKMYKRSFQIINNFDQIPNVVQTTEILFCVDVNSVFQLIHSLILQGSPYGMMAKVLDCNLEKGYCQY